MSAACVRDVANAAPELDFVCSLLSADIAHAEAGRMPVAKRACAGECGDAAITIRLLYSPAPAMNHAPIAASIEAAGFDTPSAQLDIRELLGDKTPMVDAHAVPPPMRRGATQAANLPPVLTAEILMLAKELRSEPEQASWIVCVVPGPGGDQKNDTVVLFQDAAGAFIQVFYGGEEHAYLRASPFYGKAGRIAALALGFEPPEEDCRPDRRF
jgi:hypothetical protein